MSFDNFLIRLAQASVTAMLIFLVAGYGLTIALTGSAGEAFLGAKAQIFFYENILPAPELREANDPQKIRYWRAINTIETTTTRTRKRLSAALLFALIPAGPAGLLAWHLTVGSAGSRKQKYELGARLLTAKEVRLKVEKQMRNSELEDAICFGGIPVPRELESLSFAILGSPGSGKSLAINGLLETIRRRGEKAIVFDAGGEAMSGWAATGDSILNPLDSRSESWSPFAEMSDEWDAAAVAAALIGEAENEAERDWIGHAANVLTAIIERLWRRGNPINGDLIRFAALGTPDEVKKLIHGHPAASYFMEGNERFRGSIVAMIGGRLTSFQWLDQKAGRDGFSVSEWATSDGNGWLWVPYREDQTRLLKPIRRCAAEILATALLSQETQLSRRIWIIADEFASLGKVEKLLDLASKGRKKGACLIVGIQTTSQLKAIWGDTGRDLLKNCLQTVIALRTSDGETAKFLEKDFGETEFTRADKSTSKSEGRRSESSSVRHVRQALIMASQFQTLPPRTGFLRIAGMDACQVTLPIVEGPRKVAPFIPRPAPPPPSARRKEGLDELSKIHGGT